MAVAGSPIRDSSTSYFLGMHVAQELEMHAQPPSEGSADVTAGISAAYDRDPVNGAIVVADSKLRDGTSGELSATSRSTSLTRGDGSFGGPLPPPIKHDTLSDQPP
jgi:hypothetical protein